MKDLKYKVLNKWLEIECYSIASKLQFISGYKAEITEDLITKSIRCLDYETKISANPDKNYIITLIALMWEYIDHSQYNIQKIAVKFLSRIGYTTSAVITDTEFDKENFQFSSLESPLEELFATLNQSKYDIVIGTQKFILTKFQLDIWNSMDKDRLIGISAPTSAGKSFVILLKLLDKIQKNDFDIIYIVPTLSLVNQVIDDFNKFITKFNITNCQICSSYEEGFEKNGIFVLTQEKAISIFSDKNNKFSKDTTLVVDEIQNIERINHDTDERSKILYDTLNELRYKKNIKQIILAGPRINNIDKTATAIFGKKAVNISSLDSPVLNLTYSIFKEGNKHYKLKQYCSLEKKPRIIDITNNSVIKGYGQKIYNDKFNNFLNFIIGNLSDNQNIIFAPTHSTARKIACSIKTSRIINEHIYDLIQYYKETVNENYSLCKVLKQGVTYHHGKLPHHVRRTIEKAMQESWINDIVCTTTLLQGINLPAQNIIIRNPNLYISKKKEKTVELTNYEMANLRGRAGRLLKDFIGRTFVLDEKSFVIVDGYEEDSLFENTTKDLPLDYQERFEKYQDSIIDTLLTEDVESEIKDDKKDIHYKDLTTYIRQNILRNGKNAKQKMEKVGINLTKEQIAAIKLKLDKLTIPKEICYKNRYWDPFILEFIYKNYKEDVPNYPFERGAKTKFDNMLKFLRDNSKTKPMYNRYVQKKYRNGNARGFLVDLCYKWAKEDSLADILKSKLKNTEKIEDDIEEIIEILQNSASYKVPLLLKPIFDIKNPNSAFLTCMQDGACHDISKQLIEMGIPRECALYLYKTIFQNENNANNDILEILKTNYSKLPYWIQVQLDFLI